MSTTGEDNPFLAVMRVWAAVAWADDQLAPAEASAIERLIALAELSDEDKATARGWLEHKVELDTSAVKTLPTEQRHGIYRAAVRMVRIDRVVAPEETAFLARLRQGLDLSDSDAETIERGVAPA